MNVPSVFLLEFSTYRSATLPEAKGFYCLFDWLYFEFVIVV